MEVEKLLETQKQKRREEPQKGMELREIYSMWQLNRPGPRFLTSLAQLSKLVGTLI